MRRGGREERGEGRMKEEGVEEGEEGDEGGRSLEGEGEKEAFKEKEGREGGRRGVGRHSNEW